MHRLHRVLFVVDVPDASAGIAFAALRASGFADPGLDEPHVVVRRQFATSGDIARAREEVHALVKPFGGRCTGTFVRWAGEQRCRRSRATRRILDRCSTTEHD